MDGMKGEEARKMDGIMGGCSGGDGLGGWIEGLGDGLAHRLGGNVVRAGLNSNHLLNPEIGRVAASQTLSRAVIDFTPEPYVIAQYVSVDIHGSDPQTMVQLTEVMVEEVNTATMKQATGKGLFLTGRPSSQSSTFTDSGDMRLASRAVDGHLQYVNPHCSQTNVQESPWWMINLTAVHCIRKVAIRNIDDLH
ncbi:uncharacterized protein LOC110990689, partial [Acanthaster planci]|uniref:Uncharacterized protein LOC110990689 n=1 Tax=Acanthaster planci TaxID=133434 RepID=A0A8B8A3G3_ACAPL